MDERVDCASHKQLLFSKPISDGWVEFLSRYTWDVFATLTYRPNRVTSTGSLLGHPGPDVVLKNFRYWLSIWTRETAVERGVARVDSKGRLRGTYANALKKGRRPVWVLGIENHKSGRLHSHCLIRWSDALINLRRIRGTEIWRARYGAARVEAPTGQADVVSYCTKYVCKPGAELVLSESFRACELPSRIS